LQEERTEVFSGDQPRPYRIKPRSVITFNRNENFWIQRYKNIKEHFLGIERGVGILKVQKGAPELS
jgi:hypothetical protein